MSDLADQMRAMAGEYASYGLNRSAETVMRKASDHIEKMEAAFTRIIHLWPDGEAASIAREALGIKRVARATVRTGVEP